MFANKLLSKKKLVASIVAVTLMLSATPAFASKLTGTLNISGSTTVQPLTEQLKAGFVKKNKGVKVNVTAPGSSAGIKEVQAGKVPMAGSSRELKPAEVKGGLVATKIANEALVIVVHKSNKIKGLTQAQVRDIYLGKITNWKELGGANAPIMAQGRDTASGTFAYFNEHFLGTEKPAPTVKEFAHNGLVRQAVTKNKNAIGYIGASYLNPSVKGLALDGKAPTKKKKKKKNYPVIRPLFFVTKGAPTGLSKAFIDFSTSAAGKKIAKKDFMP
jgi:phosphate transport system substrate-binding protein